MAYVIWCVLFLAFIQVTQWTCIAWKLLHKRSIFLKERDREKISLSPSPNFPDIKQLIVTASVCFPHSLNFKIKFILLNRNYIISMMPIEKRKVFIFMIAKYWFFSLSSWIWKNTIQIQEKRLSQYWTLIFEISNWYSVNNSLSRKWQDEKLFSLKYCIQNICGTFWFPGTKKN